MTDVNRLDGTGRRSDVAGGAFLRRTGERSFQPGPNARGPWGPMLHGRLIGGLCGREVELLLHTLPEFTCARLTVDLFKAAQLDEVEVRTSTLRRGSRIVVVESTLLQHGEPVGQGKAVLLRRSSQPEAQVPQLPRWNAPSPAELGDPDELLRRPASSFIPTWDGWRIPGTIGGPHGLRSDMWMRERLALVDGEELSALVRLALAADMASPIAHSGVDRLQFINADYTIYLGRPPRDEYIGIQFSGHVSEGGVAAGQCVVHDLHGPVGFISAAAIAQKIGLRARPQPSDAGAHGQPVL